MKFLEILQPEKTAGFPVDAIHSLASQLPQIGLSGYEEKDKLRKEFIDLQVSAVTYPQIQLRPLMVVRKHVVLDYFGRNG